MKRHIGLTRSPLLSGSSSLPRTGWTIRNRGLRPVSAARAREAKPRSAATGRGGMGQRKATPAGEFSPATKLLVRKRAGRGDEFEALCEAHGGWLGRDAGEYQHRDARGMGGSRDPVVNGPAGCVLLCHDCHMLAEARDRDMLGMGFWLENGQDPLNKPIMLHGAGGGGITVWLAADGLGDDGTGYLYQPPAEVAA